MDQCGSLVNGEVKQMAKKMAKLDCIKELMEELVGRIKVIELAIISTILDR